MITYKGRENNSRYKIRHTTVTIRSLRVMKTEGEQYRTSCTDHKMVNRLLVKLREVRAVNKRMWIKQTIACIR
jgi:hypothetical protein